MNKNNLKTDPIRDSLGVGVFKKDSVLFENLGKDQWLNTKEASSYLSITPNALRIMVHRKKIRAYSLSNRLRFKISDLRKSLSPHSLRLKKLKKGE